MGKWCAKGVKNTLHKVGQSFPSAKASGPQFTYSVKSLTWVLHSCKPINIIQREWIWAMDEENIYTNNWLVLTIWKWLVFGYTHDQIKNIIKVSY